MACISDYQCRSVPHLAPAHVQSTAAHSLIAASPAPDTTAARVPFRPRAAPSPTRITGQLLLPPRDVCRQLRGVSVRVSVCVSVSTAAGAQLAPPLGRRQLRLGLGGPPARVHADHGRTAALDVSAGVGQAAVRTCLAVLRAAGAEGRVTDTSVQGAQVR